MALLAAVCNSLGKVLQKRGTRDLPLLVAKAPILLLYFSNPWWLCGFLLDVTGGVVTIAAVASAPISIVQPILGCGLAFVAIFSHLVTGELLGERDWIACTICVVGTVLLGLTTSEASGHEEVMWVVGFFLIVFFVASAIMSQVLQSRKWVPIEVSTAISAGICFGLSGCATRGGLMLGIESNSAAVGTMGIALSVALTAGGFVAQTRGFKDGRTLPIVTFSNLVAMLVAILFGLLAFNEPLPESLAGLFARLAALALVVSGSVMLQGGGGGSDGHHHAHHKESKHRRGSSKDMGMTAPMARIGEQGKDEILEGLQSIDPKQV